MSFLYRSAITITRKQPYIDWANSHEEDGPELTAELAADLRTIYLLPEVVRRADFAALVDEFWRMIFEQELAAWEEREESWPEPLTRETFDQWFDVELTESVFDLTLDEPLTHEEVEEADLDDAVRHCAWCDIEVDDGEGRFAGFKLADRKRWADREGLTVPLDLGGEQMAVGVMSMADSDAARSGDDLVFRACTSRCEKALRKTVPKALRKIRRP
jgi:hypothetical protein